MSNFSDKVTKVLAYSKEEASRLHSAVILPEHLLLAMIKHEGDMLGGQLAGLCPDMSDLVAQLEQRVTATPGAVVMPDSIRLSDMATNIMRLSVMEARMHNDAVIEPKHLLLAIMHDSIDNGAKRVLTNCALTYDKMRAVMLETTDSETISEAPVNDIQTQESPAGEAQTDNVADPFEDKIIDISNHNEGDAEEEFESVGGEEDDDMFVGAGAPTRAARERKTQSKSQTPALDKYSVDLTMAAAEGKLDPVVGREKEMHRVMEILCRRKKNNPVLIGEPGVGKSAIVEGLAQMIQRHDVSPILFNKRILALDLTAIVAGTQYRGQFEQRIKMVIKELEENPDIIVFIDEIHTMIGAGSASGSMDAANIMKPALARGTIQCIGATTLDEYRKSVEKDGALERRFQKVLVEPTTAEQTLQILHNIKSRYEKHHHVTYTDEALKACVMLTERFITERAFPDKAIDALDEVGSRMHLSAATMPDSIPQMQQEIDEIRQKKKQAVFNQNFELAASYRDRQAELEEKLDEIRRSWEEDSSDDVQEVTADNVADVVSMMSGVPAQRVVDDESKRLRQMAKTLQSCVIGQDRAIEKVVKAIQRNRLGLHAHNRPIGAFMFLGPTGVGKTYLAQKLAEEMFGSADALIRIDMSEYNESFNTSRLVGAPPGYVGYEEGGQLTERVRRHPYSIVLLDEIEKAHANVYNVLLQVLDEGRLTDGNGRLIDFRNTIIIMTSNAGTRQLKDFGRGVGFQAGGALDGASMNDKDREYARSIIQKALSKQFSPEFLNRLDDIITFDQLDLTAIKQIINLELKPLRQRIETLGYKLEISDEMLEKIAEKGYDVQFGARPLKRALQTYVEDAVCERILDGDLNDGDTITIDKV